MTAITRGNSHDPFSPSTASRRRMIMFGALGGATLTAMEWLLLAPELSASDMSAIVVHILPQWVAVGIGIALLMSWFERSFNVLQLALTLLCFALTMCTALAGIRALMKTLGFHTDSSFVGTNAPLVPTFLYDLWLMLFFGGLFMTICVLIIRAERTRHLLTQAEIERGRADTMLADAQLEGLKGHVDPDFLLSVMSEIQRRYEKSPSQADLLLDRLVAFLRRAMPGIRAGHSTLADEIALATAYRDVWTELDARHAGWHLRASDTIDKLPLPSLLLLQVLDHWCVAAASAPVRELVISRTADATTLALEGSRIDLGAWLPPSLVYRLRIGLRSVCGDAWQLNTSHAMQPGMPALTLTLFPVSSAKSHTEKERVRESD